MKKIILLVALFISTISYSQINIRLGGGGNSITTNNNTHSIYIDGTLVGQGSVSGIKIPKNNCITVQVSGVGYLTRINEFCNRKGMPKMEKTQYIPLSIDDSFEATFATDLANNDIIVNPRSSNISTSWTNAVRLVVENFDALEVNDNDVKYLRTAWVVDVFQEFTVRTRLIARVTNESPLELRFKIVSERAAGQASPRDDERFRSWDRILKRYQGLIEEVQSRL